MSNHTQDIFCSQYSCKFPVFCLKRHLLACKSKYFFFPKPYDLIVMIKSLKVYRETSLLVFCVSSFENLMKFTT